MWDKFLTFLGQKKKLVDENNSLPHRPARGFSGGTGRVWMLKMLFVFILFIFASLHSGADISMWLHRCRCLKVFTVSKLRCFIFWNRRLSPAWDQFQTSCVWIKYSHNQDLVRNSFYALTEKASCNFCYVLSLFNRLKSCDGAVQIKASVFRSCCNFSLFLRIIFWNIETNWMKLFANAAFFSMKYDEALDRLNYFSN